MFDKVLDMVKTKNLVVPGMIFFHLEELGLKYDELYVIIYILNLSNKEFDMVTMSSELNMKPKELLRIVNELTEKNYVKLDLVKKESNVCEHFNLDGLYNKLAFNIIGKEEKEEIKEPTNTLFDEFEKEFTRPLTPKEFQIITNKLFTVTTNSLDMYDQLLIYDKSLSFTVNLFIFSTATS